MTEHQTTGSPWNPWKLTAIGMALVAVTALVTGLVVASWRGDDSRQAAGAPASARPVAPEPSAPETTRPAAKPSSSPAATAPARATGTSRPQPVSTTPSQTVIAACNRYAAEQAPQTDKTTEVVKDALIGAVAGAAVGAAGGAIADGGKGAGKGAAIGGLVGAGGGTLYGLNENRKRDEAYRAAYGRCMQSRGYPA